MKAYRVIVEFPFPLIGTDWVDVQAGTHAHASLIARSMRREKGWPKGSTYTPRLIEETPYKPSFLRLISPFYDTVH